MTQFSFVNNTVAIPSSTTHKLINLDDVYFITIKLFSSQANYHYQIQMVFSDKEKLTDHIIQETVDGRFIQSVQLYVMLDKIDIEQLGYGYAPSSIVCIQDGKNIQVLNLDKAEGFNIHQSSSSNVAIDSDSSFFDITFSKQNQTNGNSIVCHKSEDVKVKVSVVFNYLYQYGIETDIKQLIKAIKELDKNPDIVISTQLSNIVCFLEEHGLDDGYITIHQ